MSSRQITVFFEDDERPGKLEFIECISDQEDTSGSVIWRGILKRSSYTEEVAIKLIPSDKPTEPSFNTGGTTEVHFMDTFSEHKDLKKNMVKFRGATTTDYKTLKSAANWIFNDLDSDHPLREAEELTLMVVELAKETAFNYLHRMLRQLDNEVISVDRVDFEIACIVFQVLQTLMVIQTSDPSFRHNDLHLDNILIKNRESEEKYEVGDLKFVIPNRVPIALMYDFGLASSKSFLNWETELYDECWGVAPFVDDGKCPYDVHVFLNALFCQLEKCPALSCSKTTSFLRQMIPAVLRGSSPVKAPGGRIPRKYQSDDDSWKCIPSIVHILKHQYFDPIRK